MAVLHQPGTAPADRALEAIGSIRARGHDADFAAGDRLYSNCLPDEYHLKLRALGYKLTFDYRTDQLGLQGFVHGFIVVEGGIYSPSMPEALINATKDLRAGRISSGLYWERLAQRELYAARPKEAPDSEGHQRVQCPAAASWPGARCDLKPASKDKPHTRTKRIHITDELKADSDGRACCAQQSVTIAPEDAAKFRQELRFGTVEWQGVYNTLRNTIEGYNGFIKDEAVEDDAAPQRRRIRGTAAQTVLVGMLVFAANLRKIDAYIAQADPDEDGELYKKPRRRKTKPIVAWMAPDLPLTRGPTPTPAAA